MIPAFVDGKNLPVGGHECTLDEAEARFASNDHRAGLFRTLVEVMKIAKRCGFLYALLGGSYPTAKEKPSDIDVTWFCPPGTEKASVSPECIKIMEDIPDLGNFLYLPYDEGSGPDEYRSKRALWADALGYDAKEGTPRGVLLLSLENDDHRLH